MTKVMEIDIQIQEVLIHLVERLHSSDGEGENAKLDMEARELIEGYLQSKMESMRELIKKERDSQNEKLASFSKSPSLSSIKIAPHLQSKGNSNAVRYRPSIITRADELIYHKCSSRIVNL